MSAYERDLWLKYYVGQFLLAICICLTLLAVTVHVFFFPVGLVFSTIVARWLKQLEQALYGGWSDPPPEGNAAMFPKARLSSDNRAFYVAQIENKH